jgi:pSer/pThr/pTyr-binding forkhead associated (FHA) protein
VLKQPFALIGRDPRADLILPHRTISQRHAYLQILDGRVFIVDLDSRTGIARQSGEKCKWLSADERLDLGPFELSVAVECAANLAYDASNPLKRRDSSASSCVKASLEFLTGAAGQRGLLWPMKSRLVLIGRSPRCKVRLDGPSVSRFHCSLLRTPHGVWLVDLLGRAGVLVNKKPMRYGLLHDGDLLQIGLFLIRVHLNVAPIPADLPVPAQPFSQEYRLRDSDQLAEMNQDMLDDIRQAVLGMMHMFGMFHHEQMARVREELHELRLLTRQMIDLYNRARAVGSVEVVTELTHTSAAGTSNLSMDDIERLVAAIPPAGAVPDEGRESRKRGQNGSLATPLAERIPQASLNTSESAPAPSPARPQCGSELHGAIWQRMAEMKNEHQSRWRKILRLLSSEPT